MHFRTTVFCILRILTDETWKSQGKILPLFKNGMTGNGMYTFPGSFRLTDVWGNLLWHGFAVSVRNDPDINGSQSFITIFDAE